MQFAIELLLDPVTSVTFRELCLSQSRAHAPCDFRVVGRPRPRSMGAAGSGPQPFDFPL